MLRKVLVTVSTVGILSMLGAIDHSAMGHNSDTTTTTKTSKKSSCSSKKDLSSNSSCSTKMASNQEGSMNHNSGSGCHSSGGMCGLKMLGLNDFILNELELTKEQTKKLNIIKHNMSEEMKENKPCKIKQSKFIKDGKFDKVSFTNSIIEKMKEKADIRAKYFEQFYNILDNNQKKLLVEIK